jgi:hypothetical protein
MADDVTRIDGSEDFLNFFGAELGRLAFGPENLGVLTSRAGLMARMPFSVSQKNIIRIAAMCCLIVAAEPECSSRGVANYS